MAVCYYAEAGDIRLVRATVCHESHPACLWTKLHWNLGWVKTADRVYKYGNFIFMHSDDQWFSTWGLIWGGVGWGGGWGGRENM